MKIPDGLQFADLELEREPITKRLLCKPEPLAQLVAANDLEGQTTMLDDEELAAWSIAEWYLAHRTDGGEKDPVAEEVLAEVGAVQASDIPALDPNGG